MDPTNPSASGPLAAPEAQLAAAAPELLTLAGLAIAVALVLGAFVGAGLTTLVLTRANARLRDRFQHLGAEALDRNNERFLALAGERLGALQQSHGQALAAREEAIDALVRPLRESLARVDEKLQQVETEREGHYRSLTRHLELLATGHRELTDQTRGLRQALGTPNARGRWGELQLRRVVELAGMLEHCDFHTQATLRDGDGHARPDLIVNLPGDRQVVIDAKAPLEAFLHANEADDEASRAAALADHARHVKRHADDLGSRAYWSRLEGSPEFVVLFLPGEPFFSAAIEADPELIERAIGQRVVLAGPTTLIALLRAVAYGWQQEALARNASLVSRHGRELFDRIVSLNDRFTALGRKLDAAVDAYNGAMGSLESRVHVSARRMAELGVAPDAELESPPPIERRARVPRAPESTPTNNAARAAT